MPNYTTNYNLEKPLPSEYYDVEQRNDNWDKIDDQMKLNAAGVQEAADHAADTNNPHETSLYQLQNPLPAVNTLDTVDMLPVLITADNVERQISVVDLKTVLGVVGASLAVNTYEFATVTATDGTKTLTGTGNLIFSLPNVGSWTVTAAYGGVTATRTVNVTGTLQYTVDVPILSSLSVAGQTTAFGYGDALAFDGTATAAYYGGDTKTVTPTLSPAAGTILTDIGSQTVSAGYTENGVTVSTSYSVTVGKKSLTVPAQSGSLTYTGAAQSPTWDDNYDQETMTLGGTTSGTTAGSYNATFTLTDTTHYQWSDSTTEAKTVAWAIGGKSASGLEITLGASPTYTGSQQTQTITVTDGGTTLTAGTDYTVSGNTGTNAGSYTLTVTGAGNYAGTQTKAWSIAKAACSISVNPSSLTIEGAAGTTGTATVTRSGDGNITVSSSNQNIATAANTGATVTVTSVATGSVTVTVNVAEGTNYLAGSGTLAVTVTMFVRFNYTGTSRISGNLLYLETSGTLTVQSGANIQALVVGGGGAGNVVQYPNWDAVAGITCGSPASYQKTSDPAATREYNRYTYATNGGNAATPKNYSGALVALEEYPVVVGAGGTPWTNSGSTTAFGATSYGGGSNAGRNYAAYARIGPDGNAWTLETESYDNNPLSRTASIPGLTLTTGVGGAGQIRIPIASENLAARSAGPGGGAGGSATSTTNITQGANATSYGSGGGGAAAYWALASKPTSSWTFADAQWKNTVYASIGGNGYQGVVVIYSPGGWVMG